MVIKDQRYGKNGKFIWAFLAGPALFLGVILLLLYALLFEDFRGAKVAWFTIFGCMLIALYFLISNIQILIEAPHVAQSIEYNGKINVRLYFGREVTFSINDIESIEKYKVNRFLKLSTLLNRSGDNYLFRLNSGDTIYVASFIPGVSDFIDIVKSTNIVNQAPYPA